MANPDQKIILLEQAYDEINYWLMKSERVELLPGSQGIVNFYPNFTQTLPKLF